MNTNEIQASTIESWAYNIRKILFYIDYQCLKNPNHPQVCFEAMMEMTTDMLDHAQRVRDGEEMFTATEADVDSYIEELKAANGHN